MIRCTDPLIAPQHAGEPAALLVRAENANTRILGAIRVARFPDRASPLGDAELNRLGELSNDEARELLELRVQVDYFGHASAPVQCVRHARRQPGTAQAAA
jgi:hypothetical protein